MNNNSIDRYIDIKNMLPSGSKIIWCRIYKDIKEHIYDEDMVYIKLKNDIVIDAGQYGPFENSFFCVSVISPNDEKAWKPIESSYCKTTQEVAEEIVRLSNKYSDNWYAELAKNFWKIS